ncbi:MAG: 2-amino-4-hydroxy-6-hydroxymethyldihydropteridine diphosphokinase [Planctomycetia bacterium]|nr:2-amino-4-hydroxy-6-hydroxymethyldihydropteridine diphosphokinase [Planctomycetia bacterium]
MATALIGLGSNLADRAAMLSAAVARLSAEPDIRLVAESRQLSFPPVGGPADQPEYLNAAARLDTSLAPEALLDLLQRIENDLGRRRDVRWGPRTIDLDLLLYESDIAGQTTGGLRDHAIRQMPQLTLPHPRLALRRFVLEPAAEVAADMLHPTIGWSIARLLEHLRTHPPYVALAGPLGVGKTLAGRQAAAALRERLSIPCRTLEEPVDDEMLARFYADPTGQSDVTELEFLRMRTELLQGVPGATPQRSQEKTTGALPQPPSVARDAHDWIVSDFWFDQALAYADLWLASDERGEFDAAFAAARQKVISPKLLVVLDASPDELLRRIAERGRPYESTLDAPLLARLRDSIERLSRQPGLGPVLHLPPLAPEAVVDEIVAAVAGMR